MRDFAFGFMWPAASPWGNINMYFVLKVLLDFSFESSASGRMGEWANGRVLARRFSHSCTKVLFGRA